MAVPFDSESKRGVENILKVLKRKHWPVRWEAVEKLHITIAFLGWLELEEGEILRLSGTSHSSRRAQDDKRAIKSLARLSSAVKKGAEGIESFTVAFKGLGGFPDLVLPQVIWVGLKGDLKSLAKIYKEVRSELKQLGFTLDDKPFVPHVTLGRIRRDTRMKQRQEIGKQLDKLRKMNIAQQLMVNRVVVYESKLTRVGSDYREMVGVKLG